MAVFCAGQQASAADADRPTVWFEGGYHFEGLSGSHEPVISPLDSSLSEIGFTPVGHIQNILSKSYGAEGGISFQPEGSNWTFSGYAKYGRANGKRYVHQEKGFPVTEFSYPNPFGGTIVRTLEMPRGYEDATSKERETHTIVDFQVGKDVGLGLFGRHDRSTIAVGVHYAQMTAYSHVQVFGRPQGQFVQMPANLVGNFKYLPRPFYHESSTLADRSGSFHGLGPSISWKSRTDLLGDTNAGEVDFDWGVNAALLFGRQKLKVQHEATDRYHYYATAPWHSYPGKYYPAEAHSTAHTLENAPRTRSVTVPNVGGFVGLSYRFPNAKISGGYRADFYFGAMDGGLDAHHSINVGYHGPFATLSIGLGG